MLEEKAEDECTPLFPKYIGIHLTPRNVGAPAPAALTVVYTHHGSRHIYMHLSYTCTGVSHFASRANSATLSALYLKVHLSIIQIQRPLLVLRLEPSIHHLTCLHNFDFTKPKMEVPTCITVDAYIERKGA